MPQLQGGGAPGLVAGGRDVRQQEGAARERAPQERAQAVLEAGEQRQALAAQPGLVLLDGVLEEDVVAGPDRLGQLRVARRHGLGLGPLQEGLGGQEAAEHVTCYQVGEDKSAVVLEVRWCLRIGLLKTLRGPRIVRVVDVKTAEEIQVCDPLSGRVV